MNAVREGQTAVSNSKNKGKMKGVVSSTPIKKPSKGGGVC